MKLSPPLPPALPKLGLAAVPAWGPSAVPWQRLFDAAQACRATETSNPGQAPLRGKNLALLSAPSWAARIEGLREAAAGLGLRVSQLRADDAAASSHADMAETMRLLGRLYDAVACDGMPATTVQALQRHAGLPVLDGWSADDHPSRLLAELAALQQASGRALDGLVLGFLADAPAPHGKRLRAAARALGLRCIALAPGPARRGEPPAARAVGSTGADILASGRDAAPLLAAGAGPLDGTHAVDAILDTRDDAAWTLALPHGALSDASRAAHRRWAWQACLLEALG